MNTPIEAQPAAAARKRTTPTRRVASWREHHSFSAASSFRRLAQRPFGTLLTVAVMGLALALPLAFYLLLGNVQQLGRALGQDQTINVFLQNDQVEQQAQRLAKQLRERSDVATVTVKSPQQGLDELAKLQGFSGALDALDANPLPYVLVVAPRADLDAAGVTRMGADLRELRSVALVQDNGQWRARLDAMLGVGNRIVLVLAALLALAALLVVGNTVRMDIASRSEEISVLVLVGASGAFVRRPYLYAGIWYGLFSGVLAVALALGIEFSLTAPITRLNAAYAGKLQLGGLPPWLLVAVPLAAAALGWLGARLVSAWQLRQAV